MPKSPKTGKGRLDKYYHLAKDQGFRARSAFKLIQLAQKIDFLSKARTVLDLCAAPGGWLQVAQKNIPQGGVIVGVDLVPIKPLRNVVTLQADITTDRCRSMIGRHIEAGACDVVLHDGSPNVGANWNFDAYTQNVLVIHAAHLACDFLKKGGTFVTKVFRSQDYNALIWMLGQLFEKVNATKPHSSRAVSAEIFIICESFKAPRKIDPRFFDPQFVFLSTENLEKNLELSKTLPKSDRGISTLLKLRDKVNRVGYRDGDDFRVADVKIFFDAVNPAVVLTSHNKITFDLESPEGAAVLGHPLTTEEIKNYCGDLKVLGRSEMLKLMKWRFAVTPGLAEKEKNKNLDKLEDVDEDVDEDGEIAEIIEEDDDVKLTRQLKELEEKSAKTKKKENRRLHSKQKKFNERRMLTLGGVPYTNDNEVDLFGNRNLAAYQTLKGEASEAEVTESSEDEELAPLVVMDAEAKLKELDDITQIDWLMKKKKEEERGVRVKAKKVEKLRRRQRLLSEWAEEMKQFDDVLKSANEKSYLEKTRLESDDSDEEDGMHTESNKGAEGPRGEDTFGGDVEDDGDVPNLENLEKIKKLAAERWYSQPIFAALADEFNPVVATEEEVKEKAKADRITMTQQARLAKAVDLVISSGMSTTEAEKLIDEMGLDEEFEKSLDDEEDVEEAVEEIKEMTDIPLLPLSDKKKAQLKRKREAEKKEGKERKKKAKQETSLAGLGTSVEERKGFEVVPAVTKPTSYDEIAEIQAIGTLMIRKKSRMDVIDRGYNRYAYNDGPGIPRWFTENESRFNRPDLPVTKEMVKQLRDKMREINARPIRKVAEAKMRKNKRVFLKKKRDEARATRDEEDPSGGRYGGSRGNQKSKNGKRAKQTKKKAKNAHKGSRGGMR